MLEVFASGSAQKITEKVNSWKSIAAQIGGAIIGLVAVVIAISCLIKSIQGFKKGDMKEFGKWLLFSVLAFAVGGAGYVLVEQFGRTVESDLKTLGN